MHKVILSIASNRYQKSNLLKARQRLEEVVHDACYTAERWTDPIGTRRRDAYLNQLVAASTPLDEQSLNSRLKQIEADFGRTPTARSLGIVPIDIDILSFDGERRHLSDWTRPYVTTLIKEL